MKRLPTEMSRVIALVALCIAGLIAAGCMTNHAQVAAPKSSDQLALERTIFTDLLTANSIPASDDSHYFLSLPDSADPCPALIAQLRKTTPTQTASVDPVSKAPSHDEWLTGSRNGSTNAVVQINSIQMLDANTATADAIEASAPMAATAWHYTLTHDHTGWHVTSKQPTGAA
jgi:hypothetical protein